MRQFLQRWFVTVVAVFAAAGLVHGIHYDGLDGLLVAGLLLGFLNAFVKPVLMILSFPFLIVTLGLFTLFINALMLYFVGRLTRSFHVDSFSAAFWGGLVISIASMLLNGMIGREMPPPRPPQGGGRGGPRDNEDQGPIIDV